ncbi:MAG: DNRLRE domain-containing protein [Pedosphaera sp.]|nr:DNRLRE domain-containing protein [Pedosphaera sp.]
MALAESVSLHPSADTTLMEYYPTNNFGGNEYFNGGTTQNFTTNRALLKFNLTAIPRGSRILSATLLLDVIGQPAEPGTPSSFELHRLLRDWGEGNKSGHPPQQIGLGQPATTNEATFRDRFAFTTNSWAAPGGMWGVDFATNVSAETYIYGIDFSPYLFDSTPQFVADAQLWLNQPGTNFGWLLLSQDELSNFTARRFASREDPNRAPVLTVEYSPPRIDSLTVSKGVVTLRFHVEPGWTNVVQYSDGVNPANWQTLVNIPPLTTGVDLIVTCPVATARRFFRLWLP